ncbi:hypothetical protein ACG74X_19550 [Marivita sp. S0852]|uniref:hypothetical protein n=1 Tax=Marivita sp. S0852 TaxID=3373893 RepID=UPI003981CE10
MTAATGVTPAAPIAPAFPVDLEHVLACGVMRFFPPMEARDDTGRPLLEGRSLRWPPASSDYRPCSYAGSRDGHAHLMNVAALRQFLAHKQTALDWLAALSRARRAQVGHGNRALHLLRTTHAAYHAPKAWLLTATPDGPLSPPPSIAGAAKVAHGIYEGTLGFLHRHGLAAGQALTAHDLARDAEISGQLIGRKEVCAGPPEMIATVIALMLDPPEPYATAETNPPDNAPTAEEVTNLAQLLWQAETMAQANAYGALTGRTPPQDACAKVDLSPYVRVTFPNALEPVLAVMNGRAPAVGLLRAYGFPQAEDVRSAAPVLSALATARTVLLLPPRAPELAAMVPHLRRQSVAAIATLDHQLAALSRYALTTVAADARLLDLFFGPLNTAPQRLSKERS